MVRCGTITVRRRFDESRVSAIGCAGTPNEVAPGDTISVTVTVENDNDVGADASVAVRTTGGTTIGTANVTVPANGTNTVQVQGSMPTQTGEYELEPAVTGANSGGATP